MTPDQWQQILAGAVALAGAVTGNGWVRGKQVARQEASNSELSGQIQGLRAELAITNDKMVRLEVRVEIAEKADEQLEREMERLRVEMHSLSGRIDASNALYTEILEKARLRQASSATVEAGNPADIQDQTKVTVKKEK
jgi:chromosome segregation ATPase